MQTFLPYPDFVASAKALDYRRLGKQRTECMQILKAMKSGGGWSSHPATVMWIGYEKTLVLYWLVMCREWKSRGYVDNQEPLALAHLDTLAGVKAERPWWLGVPAFHASHRSNLLRKDADFFGVHGWTEDPTKPYLWPRPCGRFRIGNTNYLLTAA